MTVIHSECAVGEGKRSENENSREFADRRPSLTAIFISLLRARPIVDHDGAAPMAYPCRLRAYRKSYGLSQRELAVLLGLRSQGLIAEYETGRKRPGIEALVACALIFDQPVAALFPRFHTRVTRNVRLRAKCLQDAVTHRRRARTRMHLSDLITRAT